MREASGWRLSPAFDVNATPGSEVKYLATGLDFDGREADLEAAFAVSDFFRLGIADARDIASSMVRTLEGWRRAARADGISEASIEYMADCFETGVCKLKRLVR